MKKLGNFTTHTTWRTGLLLTLLVFAISCKKDKTADESCKKWEYEGAEGPDHWMSLCDDYADCSGIFQSPVDISTVLEDPTLKPLSLNYAGTKTKIAFNGHTLEFEVDAGNSISLNGATYKLVQFHFHAKSEHTILGQHYPLEAHLVHQDAVTGNRIVLSVLFEEGAENAFLNKFIANLPTAAVPSHSSNEEYNPGDLLPAGKSYVTYPGSLTTPPCTQNVIWYVMADAVTASAAQIQAFEAIMPENFRPVRPLQERAIRYFEE